MTMTKVLRDVSAERGRQDRKWGVQNHDPFKWAAILGEEVGEVSRAILEMHFGEDPRMIADVRHELVQVAAVAVVAAECIDRNRNQYTDDGTATPTARLSQPVRRALEEYAEHLNDVHGEAFRCGRCDEAHSARDRRLEVLRLVRCAP
jgi:NTP pyrophosphatase (non-canonical NTP hydrolase)